MVPRLVARYVFAASGQPQTARHLNRVKTVCAGLGRITGLPVSGSDYQHMLTTQLTKQFGIIDLADLKLPGLIQNHHLAQTVASAPLAEVSRQCQ